MYFGQQYDEKLAFENLEFLNCKIQDWKRYGEFRFCYAHL